MDGRAPSDRFLCNQTCQHVCPRLPHDGGASVNMLHLSHKNLLSTLGGMGQLCFTSTLPCSTINSRHQRFLSHPHRTSPLIIEGFAHIAPKLTLCAQHNADRTAHEAKLYPEELTSAERDVKTVTKHRWMTVRDDLSTIKPLAYRIDGLAGCRSRQRSKHRTSVSGVVTVPSMSCTHWRLLCLFRAHRHSTSKANISCPIWVFSVGCYFSDTSCDEFSSCLSWNMPKCCPDVVFVLRPLEIRSFTPHIDDFVSDSETPDVSKSRAPPHIPLLFRPVAVFFWRKVANWRRHSVSAKQRQNVSPAWLV